MLESLFGGAQSANLGIMTVIVGIILSFVLALIIAFVYKKTHEGISYSKTFTVTLVLMSVLISIVMVVIGNNLAKAFTLLGAFAIIRFRTAVKDTRDTAFVFWALVTGMAVGTRNYGMAVVSTVMVAVIIYSLKKFNFGSMRHYDHLLTFMFNAAEGGGGAYQAVFDKYLKESSLINVATREGNMLDFTFNITLDRTANEVAFMNELKTVSGISNVNLIATSKDAEY